MTIEPNSENVISVSQIGTVVAQLRKEKRYASQNIFSLTPLKNIDKLLSLFIVSAINKSLMWSFSDWYANYPTLDTLKDLTIQLPTKNWHIDFEFIEEFVAELEAERVAELRSYLEVTWLSNYELTNDEKRVLEEFEDGKFIYKEFEIQLLFNVSPSKAYKMNDDDILIKNWETPYVSNQSQNNGYIGWSNFKPLNPSNVITLSDTWQSEKTIFYQPIEFIGKSHLQVMQAYDTKFQKNELMFVISSFRRAILELNYDYGTKFNRGKINTTKIQLPIQEWQIDFESMTTFISAIQKLVIRDVVEYTDQKISTTKSIIKKQSWNIHHNS